MARKIGAVEMYEAFAKPGSYDTLLQRDLGTSIKESGMHSGGVEGQYSRYSSLGLVCWEMCMSGSRQVEYIQRL